MTSPDVGAAGGAVAVHVPGAVLAARGAVEGVECALAVRGDALAKRHERVRNGLRAELGGWTRREGKNTSALAASFEAMSTGTRVEVHPGREAVVDFDPDLTFECVDECTWCCTHGVLLYEQDFYELAQRASLDESTTQFRGEDFVRKEAKDRDEHVGPDGEACVFLRDDGLCSLHAEHDWKPTRCSVYPLAVSVEGGDIHVDVRDSAWEHCEGMNVSERKVIENLDAFLPEVLWDLDDPSSDREL